MCGAPIPSVPPIDQKLVLACEHLEIGSPERTPFISIVWRGTEEFLDFRRKLSGRVVTYAVGFLFLTYVLCADVANLRTL